MALLDLNFLFARHSGGISAIASVRLPRRGLLDNFTSRWPKTTDSIQCPPSHNFRIARHTTACRPPVALVSVAMTAHMKEQANSKQAVIFLRRN
jgi:hypothetical protein